MSYQQLHDHFTKLSHLRRIDSLLGWDEQVMMPAGSGESRADAMATLNGLQHQLLTESKLNDWLQAAKLENLDSPWQTSNLNWLG